MDTPTSSTDRDESLAEASAISQVPCNPALAIEFGYEQTFPNVEKLFEIINTRLFQGEISDCYVKLSKTLYCAVGTTRVRTQNERGIRLSWPTLRLRPLSDTLDALLHEAVHAYQDTVGELDPPQLGHGRNFLHCLARIFVKHGFWIKDILTFEKDDSDNNIQYFRCKGVCQHWEPFFGVLRREPSISPNHNRLCGGELREIKHCGVLIPKHVFQDSFSQKKERMCSRSEEIVCFLCNQSIQRGNLRAHWNECLKHVPVAVEENFLTQDMETADPKDIMFACPMCHDFYKKEDLIKHLDDI